MLDTRQSHREAEPREGSSPPAPASVDLPGLLRAAGAGDDRAWRAIIDLYSRRVYALVKSRVGPGRHDLAEEVTQSVFVTVATKLGRRDEADGGTDAGAYVEQGRFEAWLFRIVMNRLRDEMRRQKRHAAPTDPGALVYAAETAVEESGEDMSEELRRLRSAVSLLSESDRQVVELRHHAGLSFKQIAELLEEPLGTLLARHHRALKKLKDTMTGPAPAPARPA